MNKPVARTDRPRKKPTSDADILKQSLTAIVLDEGQSTQTRRKAAYQLDAMQKSASLADEDGPLSELPNLFDGPKAIPGAGFRLAPPTPPAASMAAAQPVRPTPAHGPKPLHEPHVPYFGNAPAKPASDPMALKGFQPVVEILTDGELERRRALQARRHDYAVTRVKVWGSD